MGDTTDELLDLAKQSPGGRRRVRWTLLLTSGERISNSLVAMAISALGAEALSFTGSQAGVITDSSHGKGADHRRHAQPGAGGAGRGQHLPGGRLPGA